MRAVIQRVCNASVETEGRLAGSIGRGLLVFLGIEELDSQDDIGWLASKIAQLRIFSDQEGLMNLALADIGGNILLVSQFTLHASTRKGNRPSFIRAARPEMAEMLFLRFRQELERILGHTIETGVFGANMQVRLTNDGPVTIWIDSRNRE